jgi:predicted nucleotidyltransferase
MRLIMDSILEEKVISVQQTVYERVGRTPDFLCLTGSRLYGLDRPDSDYDIRGFVMPSAETLLGRKPFEQVEIKDPDAVVWSFPKFFHLLEIGSPNVVELLWAKQICLSVAATKLFQNKHLFLGKHLIAPFVGFAKSEWKKSEKTFGDTGSYEPKGACHCIRLLWQLEDLLENDRMIFPPEYSAAALMEIKIGHKPFTQVKDMYTDSLLTIEELEEKCDFPDRPDKSKLDALYYDIIASTINKFFKDSQTCDRCQPF